MPYSVSLEEYTPGQRYDGDPWTGARVDYSATRDGVFALVESFVFADPDDDPEDPATRDFTTDLSPAPVGWFKVTFTRGAVEQPASPVYFPHPGARPSRDDIATILWARTKDKVGNVGSFSADTRPTATQVDTLIDQGLADVAMRAGTIPEGLEEVAREAVALKVAATIERSYFPEQAAEDNSAYSLFREDYLELIARIIEATFDTAGGAKGVVNVPVLGSHAFDPLTGEVLA